MHPGVHVHARRHRFAVVAVVTASLATAVSCNRCGKQEPDLAHTDTLKVPAEKEPLELLPLPEPPAVHIQSGAFAGIPAGPLTVVVARPQGVNSSGARPAVTFNKPVVALGDRDAAKPPQARIEPAVKGAWKWIGSSSIEFAPDEVLPYATKFTVTLGDGLVAVDGEKLQKPYTFSFETVHPRVVRSDPEAGWRWLPPDGKIALVFNQPMADDFARHVTIKSGGKPVAYDVVDVVDVEAERAKKQHAAPPARSSWGRETRYVLKPKATLASGEKLTVSVDGSLAGKEGPITAEPKQLSFAVAGAMRFTGVRACESWRETCPYGPVVLQATNEPDVESLLGKVHFDPPAVIDDDEIGSRTSVHDGATASIQARFRPGLHYKIVVDAGVKDALGQEAPAFSGTFKLDDVEPDLRVDSSLALIEGGGDDSYPVEAVNVDEVRVSVLPLLPAEMAGLMRDPRAHVVGKDAIATTVDTSAERNVAVRVPLKLGALLPSGAPKLFRLALIAPEVGHEPSYVLGQITDLVAHAKLGATSGVVWVTSLSKGAPVAGATVTLYDTHGKALESETSDDDGIAHVKGLADLVAGSNIEGYYSAPEVLVSAQKDGDTGVSFSSWEGEIGPSSAGMDVDFDGDVPRALGFVATERGIYRPGDEVDIKGVVRLRRRGVISLPKIDSEVHVEVRTYGKTVAKQDVPLTRFGTFSTKVKLPEGGSLGWHELAASATVAGKEIDLSTSFRVEEYRAPKFKVDVTTERPAVVAGEHLIAHVDARYLFGGAMPGAHVDTTVVRETADFTPEGFDEYAFGKNVWGFDDGEPEGASAVVFRKSDDVGADGTLAVDVGETEAVAGRTVAYEIESEVEDVSRQRVANRARVIVHPASVYAGVRTGDGFGEVNKPLHIGLIAVGVDGQRVAGTHIEVAVKRREWKSIKKKDPDTGRFITMSEPQETPVSTCSKVSDASADVGCDVTPERAGLYIIEATATDDHGRKQTTTTSTYVVGGAWVSWQRTDGDQIDLVADKKLYEAGDTARVLVKSPWPDAEALVTVEREGVLWTRRQKVSPSSTVDIPITDGMVPNVFVSVVVVRGRVPDDAASPKDAASAAAREADPGRPQVRVGYAKLEVDKREKRLDVAVDAGAGTHRPGEKLKLKIAVKDFEGHGAPAEVALWAVDEAVLRLTDYSVPDPVAAIHPPRGLSVRLGEPLIFLIKKQRYGEKGRPPGGDGGAGVGGGFRSNFKTTAFFVPQVETDEQGRAEVEVKLPDDLTTYRVMALAVTEGDRAGSGRTDIVVQKPLLALPALPRLARVGDTFSAGVIVHAQQAGDVKVKVDAQGLALDGPPEQTVRVEAGRAREVRFSFAAKSPGTARLRFEVIGGGERDGVEHLLPVVLPMVMETVAATGDTDGKREEALAPPAGVYPGVGGLQVSLASTALAGYQDALEQLVAYPYGCAEQLSSRLVPFMALRELEGAFGVPHKGGDAEQQRTAHWLGLDADAAGGVPDPDRVADKTVRALEDLQSDDGGFRYWGSSSCSDPWASSYATLALSRAKELGYAVDDSAVSKAKRFLATKVAADRLPSCGWQRHASLVERAFAVWALARTGEPKNSFIEGLFDKRADLPLFAKAMLADASYVGKADDERAGVLLQEVMNGAKETARDVHFEETDPRRWSSYWSSDVRTSAVVLMTLVDGEPDHPFVGKIAHWLGTERKGGRYRSTQEAAFALMALTEVVRAKEHEPPRFEATVSLAGKPLITQRFDGRSLDIFEKLVPMSALGAGGQAPLVFEKTGSGTLSYTAALRYAKKEMPTTPLDAGIAVQRWFEPWSTAPGTGRALKVRAGELVRVKARVATSAERKFVAVEVPLPAGLEIVDESLASTASHAPAGEEGDEGGEGGEDGEYGDEGEGEGEEYAVWSPFNHVELRDDRAVFFSDDLPPGVHTTSITARATTPGTFVLKPATAEEMYAPETSGRSDGGTFEVVAP